MRAQFETGSDYPVLSYRIGDDHCAEFAGVQRRTSDCDDHRANVNRLKRAHSIVESIYADRAGGSHFLDRSVSLDKGYCVSLAGFETCIDWEGHSYREVYADIVDKLDWLESIGFGKRPCCVGWWTCDGQLYLDICVIIFDRAAAIDCGKRAGQKAIYDMAGRCDITL